MEVYQPNLFDEETGGDQSKISDKLVLPERLKGKVQNGLGGGHLGSSREWNEDELEWALMLQAKGFNMTKIAECLERSLASVSLKLKRHKKDTTKYNEPHKELKYQKNAEFLSLIAPNTILDVYSGEVSWYTGKANVISNDKLLGTTSHEHYNLDALDLICTMFLKKAKFDLIDLDPFGSAFDCFDLAIKMAEKGIVITLGEMGHKRWKRTDFVGRYYGINTMETFNTENVVGQIIGIGERNKKKLVPVFICDWRNISRVYFKIEPTDNIYH